MRPCTNTFFHLFQCHGEKAFETSEDSDLVYLRTRLDGNLFNLRRLKAHSLTTIKIVRELLFADAALVAHSESALQKLTYCFAKATEIFGLVVSLQKTVVMHQPAQKTPHTKIHINIGETELKTVPI